MFLKSNKIYFYIILLFSFSCKKEPLIEKYKDVSLKDKKVYILYRETDSKMGKFIQPYNINGSKFSHVGVGFFYEKKFKVFHVLPNSTSLKNCLLEQSVKEFYNPINDEIKSGEILIVKNMNNNDFVKIQNKIISMKNKNIVFDNNFYTIKDNMYYCSEFVCEILNSTKKFNFIITKKKLSGLDSIYLKRDTLKYIPVDIFLNSSPFELIKKWEN